MPFDPQFWTELFGEIISNVLAWLPNLLGAVLLVLLGWVVASLVQLLLAGLLRRLRLDRLSERAGISQLLDEAGLDPSASKLIARIIYWLVLLVFLLAAVESLGMAGVAQAINGLVAYLPNVLAAALILLLGGLIANFVGDTVSALTAQAGVVTGPVLGQIVRYALLGFILILALQQLGIQTDLLTAAAVALVAALALALALAFGLGSRELARNIMAGFHAKESFEVGQNVRVRGYSGRLVSIGSVTTKLETESGVVSLPNFILTDEEVTILKEGQEAE